MILGRVLGAPTGMPYLMRTFDTYQLLALAVPLNYMLLQHDYDNVLPAIPQLHL